jgi:hypothetical protein
MRHFDISSTTHHLAFRGVPTFKNLMVTLFGNEPEEVAAPDLIWPRHRMMRKLSLVMR